VATKKKRIPSFYIKEVVCNEKDAPERCYDCNRKLRVNHVHYMKGFNEWYVSCVRCAWELGAC